MKELEYTTLRSVNWQKANTSSDTTLTATGQDELKRRYIKAASRWITRHTKGRQFVPVQQSRAYRNTDVVIRDNGTYELQLDDDLLQVVSITNGDADSTAITSAQYELTPLNTWPKHYIENVYGQGVNWSFTNRSSKMTVNGFWGYHNNYDSAWLDTDALDSSLDASSLTFDVSDGTQFYVGEYLLVDTEIMQIDEIATNTLTVTRGANDSTAATHDSASVVYKYRQVPDIELACHQLVNWLIDTRTATESRVQFAMDIPLVLENKIPRTIWDIVLSYEKPDFRATSIGVWG